MDPSLRRKVAPAVTLIVLGLGLYGMQFLSEGTRPVVVTLLGGLSLAGYFGSGSRFLLWVGGLLVGVGIGLFGGPKGLEYFTHSYLQLGLGIGFLLVYLCGLLYERKSHWLPLVPSIVFFLLGFQGWRRFRQFVFSREGWPILLVILGALMLFGTIGRHRRHKKQQA
ncbi:MAG: hypothetical protein OER88_08825 [Planctomycetota bacterium]|nr:hypothetical protein [Planctomycetota bacterium]